MNQKTLFIFPKRGLFSITKCSGCGYIWQCDHCDANLVTYRKWEKNLELVCHQCQSYYNYPLNCPKCNQLDIVSSSGGVEELVEILESESDTKVHRYDEKPPMANGDSSLAVTTRIFDPSIPYSNYSYIVFVQAHNLLASPDYLVQEEIHKALLELFLSISGETEIIVDTHSPDLEFFTDLTRLNSSHEIHQSVSNWHTTFLDTENKNRELFEFPPYKNVLLITTQEKKRETALEKVQHIAQLLASQKSTGNLLDISISKPYPSRFLRRKGMYSYHILVRFPRNYMQIKQLRKFVMEEVTSLGLQVRLNPRHLF
jgi:primosomal protein N' (replication factor Y) (superfamily II helicase)